MRIWDGLEVIAALGLQAITAGGQQAGLVPIALILIRLLVVVALGAVRTTCLNPA